jgi:excisionase family DNA binding protein
MSDQGITATRIYTVAKAAEAVDVSVSFLRKQIKSGKLKASRLGTKVLKIKGTELERWFDEQELPSASTGSCRASEDGSRSGQKSETGGPAERGLASALRSRPA